MSAGIRWAERGLLPDPVVAYGIRRLLKSRLESIDREGARDEVISKLSNGPIAVETEAANEQHYEVPAGLFTRVLGPRLKYSACLWENGCAGLEEAEEAMLSLTCERAELADGQSILELGCGWGSLTLWMAEQFPSSNILAISNSSSQREFIERRLAERGLDNVRVQTVNVAKFSTNQRFDRVISVEMFEHVRNWRELFARVASWLRPEGRLFLHVFCHRYAPYFFEVEDETDWMARYFFTGGVMPSEDLALQFNEDLEVAAQWWVDGSHYEKTARAWLQNLDRHRVEVHNLFTGVYGAEYADKWVERWRIFFLACAELFGFHDGGEWGVTHVLLRHPDEKEAE